MMGIATIAAALASLFIGILLGAALQAGWSIVDMAESAKQWQTLIAAVITIVVTVIGLLLAWKSAKQQLRINVVGREEDRIERSLAGLKDAAALLANVSLAIAPKRAVAFAGGILDDLIDRKSEQHIEQAIAAKIPNADNNIQQRVCELFRELYWRSSTAQATAKQVEQLRQIYKEPNEFSLSDQNKIKEELAEARVANELAHRKAREAISKVKKLEDEFDAKIQRWATRLPKLRKEIDIFFAD